jgi:hypothetical protein
MEAHVGSRWGREHDKLPMSVLRDLAANLVRLRAAAAAPIAAGHARVLAVPREARHLLCDYTGAHAREIVWADKFMTPSGEARRWRESIQSQSPRCCGRDPSEIPGNDRSNAMRGRAPTTVGSDRSGCMNHNLVQRDVSSNITIMTMNRRCG